MFPAKLPEGWLVQSCLGTRIAIVVEGFIPPECQPKWTCVALVGKNVISGIQRRCYVLAISLFCHQKDTTARSSSEVSLLQFFQNVPLFVVSIRLLGGILS